MITPAALVDVWQDSEANLSKAAWVTFSTGMYLADMLASVYRYSYHVHDGER